MKRLSAEMNAAARLGYEIPDWRAHAASEEIEVVPEALPEGIPPVPAFDYELLPRPLQSRVRDIVDRMQCPPDYVAVALIVTLASLIGRRVMVKPKKEDDWNVVPNLWGAIVGRPGVLKSPALAEVMKPLRRLQHRALELHENNIKEFKADEMFRGEREKVVKDAMRKLMKQGDQAEAKEQARGAAHAPDHKPICRRYIVNDSTVEKLGEILKENPMGVMLFRDEMAGFFRNLDKTGREGDRAFYLECWNGDGSFTYDRIGRGTLHIPAACLSMLGGIQPGPLSEVVRRAAGVGDDGLLQRFQLLVYPDTQRSWRNVDRRPDQSAIDEIDEIVARFDRLNAAHVGAEIDDVVALRFDADAQRGFDTWRATLETRLRSEEEHPLMEAQLAKYRSLVPSLALVLHLTECDAGPIGNDALERAIAWANYLEPHARRVYAPGITPDVTAAHLLATRIEKGEVDHVFTARDIYRCCWSGLTNREIVLAGLNVLADHHWIHPMTVETGGKPRTDYRLNPKLIK